MKAPQHRGAASDRPEPPKLTSIAYCELLDEKKKQPVTPSVLIDVVAALPQAITEATLVYREQTDAVIKALHAGAEFDLHTDPCAQTWFSLTILSALRVNRMLAEKPK